MSFHDSLLPAGLPDPTEGWPRLKLLQGVLDRNPFAFGQLKMLATRLVKCAEIYEKAADNRGASSKLRTDLENVFENLEPCFTGAYSLVITTSIESLCRSLQEELDYVEGKRDFTTRKRRLEGEYNTDDVLGCYQHIHTYLQRLSLNVHLSMWKLMDEQAMNILLDRLCTSISARYNSSRALEMNRRACAPGTRVDVLAQIHSWVYNPNSGSIYWLNGMAGTGKTTIAYTLCAELDASYQLCASFFCSRLLPECQDVNLILPSIAYQLAQFSRPFRYILAQALEKDRNIQNCLLGVQFESLIVRPLLAVRETLPEDLVIVIDALDECNNQECAGLLLEELSTRSSDLPIKFFFSSRPEPEIRVQLLKQANHQTISRLTLHELDKGIVQADIGMYLRQELAPITPTEPQIKTLLQRSGVFFMYAATAVRYIGLKNVRHNSRARLETVLNVSAKVENHPFKDIDDHYCLILSSAIDDPSLSEAERRDISQILYTVLCVRKPLTIQALSGLLGLNDIERVRVALQSLWSVLHVVETSGLVTTLHDSFADYMFDPKRSGKYYCDSIIHDQALALCCFNCIKTAKRQFNICGLESSYVSDAEIPNLQAKIENEIVAELSYSCRYWASHLDCAQGSADVIEQLQSFLSTQLLLWMEVMNLKKWMRDGVRAIQQAKGWCIRQRSSEGLVQLAHDAWRFAASFASSTVAQSTPHIYVSMLPFWPTCCPISWHYARRMRASTALQGLAIARRRIELLAVWPVDGELSGFAWSPDGLRLALAAGGKILLLDGTSGKVTLDPLGNMPYSATSIAYSYDGTRFVSGSQDGTISVWDAESGSIIVGPLKAHEKTVNAVAFSHDGTRIMSGSADKTVCVWDVQGENVLLGPLTGHSGSVTSVGFLPDGTLLFSLSDDMAVCLWNTQTGQTVPHSLIGRNGSIRSVGFSPDGTCIASGDCYNTVRLWEIKGGPKASLYHDGRSVAILSVAFSPDSTRIVSGSEDKTIRVWDIQSRQMVLGPLEGHTNSVKSVAFSPDGTRIISGSDDKTICIWDIQNRQATRSPLKGHTDAITSVAFSPDGSCIVSGSNDKTICVWDLLSGGVVVGPLSGHSEQINSVAFSPDGTRVVAGAGSLSTPDPYYTSWSGYTQSGSTRSPDNSIRIWDIRSGYTVLGPLQGHTALVASLAFSPDGTRLVSGSHDRTIRVWDARSGQLVRGPLNGHTSYVRSVGISPDGTRIVSGSDDNTIRIWDMHSGNTVLGPLTGHTSHVTSVGFSPDNTRLVSGSDDNTIRVWDIQSGQMVLGPLKEHTMPVLSVGFSPDGTHIVSGSSDKTIRVWDITSGQTVLGPLQGHTDSIMSVGFSSDGARIVSGSKDTTIRVWDVQSTQISASRPMHPTPTLWQIDSSGWVTDDQSRLLAWVPPDLRRLLLSPDDRLIFKTSPDGYLYLNFDDARIGGSWAEAYLPT